MNLRSRILKPIGEIGRAPQSVLLPCEERRPFEKKKLLKMEGYVLVRGRIRRYPKLVDGSETGLVTLIGFEEESASFRTAKITQ